MFFNKGKIKLVFSHLARSEDKLFPDIYGCDGVGYEKAINIPRYSKPGIIRS